MLQIQLKLVKNPNWWKLTSWLFTHMGKELKLEIALLKIQLVLRAGIEPETSDSKSSVVTMLRPKDELGPFCLKMYHTAIYLNGKMHSY